MVVRRQGNNNAGEIGCRGWGTELRRSKKGSRRMVSITRLLQPRTNRAQRPRGAPEVDWKAKLVSSPASRSGHSVGRRHPGRHRCLNFEAAIYLFRSSLVDQMLCSWAHAMTTGQQSTSFVVLLRPRDWLDSFNSYINGKRGEDKNILHGE
jgi:hypothetical protein